MSTVYEIKAHVLPLLNNGSRIKVKIFMMTKNRQGVRQQEFLHYPRVVMKESLPIDSMGAPDKPCGVGRADANPKLLLNDT